MQKRTATWKTIRGRRNDEKMLSNYPYSRSAGLGGGTAGADRPAALEAADADHGLRPASLRRRPTVCTPARGRGQRPARRKRSCWPSRVGQLPGVFPQPGGGRRALPEYRKNPNCCLYFGIGTGRDDLVRLLPTQGVGALNAHCTRSETGWDLYYSLPFSLLRLFFPAFHPHGIMRGNFYKCGDLTQQEHYLAWNRVACAEPDFHRPEFFGELVFA